MKSIGIIQRCALGCALAASVSLAQKPDAGCETYQAWIVQGSPRSDASGRSNQAFPEANATYWVTALTGALGSSVTIKGQYPSARYMALQVYDQNQNLLGALNDAAINPDAGQNNPFRTATDLGSYTVQMVFGRQPQSPPPNTLYTSGATSVLLIYRVYYSNNPSDLTGGTSNPVLPLVHPGSSDWSTCPPRPILVPEDSTVWGRLDNTDYSGAIPANSRSFGLPNWSVSSINGATPYFPNADNGYMSAMISRTYLMPPWSYDMLVTTMRAPGFDNTQAGVPPYAPAQTRFWSLCVNEPWSTSVVRCLPDYLSPVNSNGFVTHVISDPGKAPSASVLSQWNAAWIPWGALYPGDTVYAPDGTPLTNADGVYYYASLLYRQTLASSSFTQSIVNVAKLPVSQQKAAMGDYWPQTGYCKAADFQTWGPACISKH